jgi:putative ABC transport system permease protein
MFSVINAVLLRPLPFPSPDALVAVSGVDQRRAAGSVSLSASWPDFFDWRSKSTSFEHLSAYRDGSFTLAGGGRPLHITGAVVSSELFSTLGTQPVLGRGFRLEDESGGDVVVISDSLWRSQFAAAPDVVGRTVVLNARPFTIIGVMPAAFNFPIKFPPAQAWITVAEDARVEHPDDTPITTERGAHFSKSSAGSGAGDGHVGAGGLDVIAAALARGFPKTRERGSASRGN